MTRICASSVCMARGRRVTGGDVVVEKRGGELKDSNT